MIYDKLLSLCEDKDLATAITSSVVDLGQEKPNLGAAKPPFYLIVFTDDAAGAGTVTFKVQQSDDNSTFTDLLSFTVAGTAIKNQMAVALPIEHGRYVRLVTTVSGTVSGTVKEAVLHNEFALPRTAAVVGFDVVATID